MFPRDSRTRQQTPLGPGSRATAEKQPGSDGRGLQARGEAQGRSTGPYARCHGSGASRSRRDGRDEARARNARAYRRCSHAPLPSRSQVPVKLTLAQSDNASAAPVKPVYVSCGCGGVDTRRACSERRVRACSETPAAAAPPHRHNRVRVADV